MKKFIDSFKNKENINLIETIQKGYDVCFETTIFDISPEERKKQREENLEEHKENIQKIPKKTSNKRKITKKHPELWQKAKLIIGKGNPIANHAWNKVNAVYNNLIKEKQL